MKRLINGVTNPVWMGSIRFSTGKTIICNYHYEYAFSTGKFRISSATMLKFRKKEIYLYASHYTNNGWHDIKSAFAEKYERLSRPCTLPGIQVKQCITSRFKQDNAGNIGSDFTTGSNMCILLLNLQQIYDGGSGI